MYVLFVAKIAATHETLGCLHVATVDPGAITLCICVLITAFVLHLHLFILIGLLVWKLYKFV